MADLLIYSPDDTSNLLLHDLAVQHKFRVKSTSDYETARKWLDLRVFDILFVHASVSVAKQQLLAGKLWDNNPIAPCYMFDLQSDSEKLPYARLFGAEVALGDNAMSILENALKSFNENKLFASDEFKIMIVEDLDSPREIISIFLENLGYDHVEGHSSAQKALEDLKGNPKKFSCVITDIRMPKMTGEDLIKEIRSDKNLSHLPVVVLTAYGTVDCLIDCLEAGATGFLVKPPKSIDMQREVRRALRILTNGLSPRLASGADVEAVKSVLLDRGV